MSVGQVAMNEKRALRRTGSRSGCWGSAMTYGEKSPATSTSTRSRCAASSTAAVGLMPTIRVPPEIVMPTPSGVIP
jgi:hypothetical protein